MAKKQFKYDKKVADKAFDKMADAIGKYIASMGGSAAVIGGVAVGQDAGSLSFNYYLRVNVTGRRPTVKNL